jgi:hypothetical protein
VHSHPLDLCQRSEAQSNSGPISGTANGQSSAATYAMVQRGLGVAIMEPFSAPLFEPFGVVVRPFLPRLTYDFIAGLKHGGIQSAAMSQIIGLTRNILEQRGTI